MNGPKVATDLSSMTDEEIMNFTEEDIVLPDQASEGGSSEGVTDDESGELDNRDDETGGADDDIDSKDTDTDSGDPLADNQDPDTGSDGDDDEDEDSPGDDQSTDKDDTDKSEDDQDGDESTFKAKYNELMAPFRAAKREVRLDNIEDARRLMQMGVDYSRKMETMKPHLRVLRTLEKAGLTDPSRINFLIDLEKKNPEAIKKLLKDNDIDPMTLNLEGSDTYVPTDHTPSDSELKVRDVLEHIKDDEKFDVTIDVITKRMDTASRETLKERPEVIAELHNHIEAGVYDIVQERVANERMLGRLKGLSDLEAYYTVGDRMYQAGELGNQAPNADTATSAANKPKGTAQGSGSGAEGKTDANLRNRKSAAKPTRGRPAKGGKKIPDFSKMTDAQIEELDIASF